MASRDPAFMWETELLRSPQRRHDTARRGRDDPGDWVTIREASEATDVPTSTIRKWARNDNIPSFMDLTKGSQQRMVSMHGIKLWAEKLGRNIDSPTRPEPAEARPEAGSGSAQPQSTITVEPDLPEPPEGTMLVPLDAWNRMLNQLGNLHEAGQQLAEARERAAKAETEARFLKERLAELRTELDSAKNVEPGPDRPDAGSSEEGPSSASLFRSLYQTWRAARRSRS